MQFENDVFFKSIFNNEFLGTGILDSNRNILKVNDCFLRMTGYSESEIIGKHYLYLTFKEDLNLTQTTHNQLDNQNYLNYEKRLIKKNGESLWCKVTISKVEFQNETYYVSIIEDITNLVLRNEISNLKNTQLEIILESALVGICCVDENLKIEYSNEKLPELLGYKLDEILKMNLKEFYHPDELLDMSKKLSKGNFKDGYQVLRRYRHKLGHYVHVNINVSVLPPNNFNYYALAIMEDITKQVESELIIEQQKVMLINASKMAALGEMAAGIAHEINNPLSIIMGKTLKLKRSLVNSNGHEFLNDIDKIENTTKRIAKIVNGLRVFSNGKDQSDLEEINLLTIIESTYDLCEEKLKNSEVTLEINCNKEILILTRQVQLSQVILNLLNNAHDAIENNINKWIKIIVLEENDLIKVKIVDSGEGIPDEIADKIMNPFFTTKAAGKGTGIGLSISQKIIHDLGGRLYYDKFNNQNTSFVIELKK